MFTITEDENFYLLNIICVKYNLHNNIFTFSFINYNSKRLYCNLNFELFDADANLYKDCTHI